jgi:hypothetical protein
MTETVTTEEMRAAGVEPFVGVRRRAHLQAEELKGMFLKRGMRPEPVSHLIDMFLIGAAAGARYVVDALLAAPGPEGRALVLASLLEDLQKLSEDPLTTPQNEELRDANVR